MDDGVNVIADVLSPLTLVLNEIISNSIKHGFAPGQSDKNYISL